MYQLINNIILEFRKKVKREKTFRWFAILVIGLMVRVSRAGVTSVIGALRLDPGVYHKMLHYFRSKAYKVTELYGRWMEVAMKYGTMVRICGRLMLIGDHIKVSKEGLRMPGVHVMHQDSENSGKGSYITGHQYGQVGAVLTNGRVSRSIPLITELQRSPAKGEKGDSLVTQMAKLAVETAKTLKERTVVALDAYFCKNTAWEVIDQTLNADGERQVELVTRGRKNTVAYRVPVPPTGKKRGQPPKYGEKVALMGLFSDKGRFTETTMEVYGKKARVRYLCLDLIWKPVKKLVRFVLAEIDGGRCILMSSSLTLGPEDIITVYTLRFKIEPSFDEQKNDVGSFDYRFWSASLRKRGKWQNAAPSPNENVDAAARAAQSFVCLSTIATGILSLIAFSHNREIWSLFPGWLKTLRSDVPSIATVKSAIAASFHDFLPSLAHLKVFAFFKPIIRKIDFLFSDFA